MARRPNDDDNRRRGNGPGHFPVPLRWILGLAFFALACWVVYHFYNGPGGFKGLYDRLWP